MKNVRVGVIGVGYLGKFHAEKYCRMDNVELVGVVDIDQSRAKDIGAALGISAFTDYRSPARPSTGWERIIKAETCWR